ncbi:hypothetical protein E8E13_000504 [Curvularia kusanoi]|uniref:O-methyltransferase C-terminal domain-containing protein n=1 Tax=Curvularia kusanoi TaxID=90978 RepID=A0A9P4T438_CURKU|nr:hypothetical protein E8E13_000504 [Curvularia kusanoi]
MASRVLLQLTNTIHQRTAQVDAYIQANGLPEPSFDPSYPPILRLSPEIDAARNAALEAIDELRAHLLGPLGLVMEHIGEMSQLVSLHGITHFGIPAALPADGTPIQVTDLASKTGMHIDDAKSLVRHASSRHLLHYLPGGLVSHSAASKAIVAIPPVSSVVACTALVSKSLNSVIEVMAESPGSQDLQKAPYSRAHNTNLSFFDHLATQPERARQFADSMSMLMNVPQLDKEFVFAYDWAQHAEGTVVDVGGSHGNIAFPLAERFPQIKVVVQDRPEVVATASVDRHANVAFEAHDFFAAQPRHGADVYFLRYIFHDWPESYCVKILQGLLPALKTGARIVIMDAIVPEPGVLKGKLEWRITASDLAMKALFNARERTEGEWRDLIRKAEPGGMLHVVEVLQPKGSQLGFIVVEWVG